MFWVVYDPYCAQKKSDDVDTAFLAKITANVQKRLKTVSFGADFLYDENIDHTEKKAQNSNVEWARLHCEN